MGLGKGKRMRRMRYATGCELDRRFEAIFTHLRHMEYIETRIYNKTKEITGGRACPGDACMLTDTQMSTNLSLVQERYESPLRPPHLPDSV